MIDRSTVNSARPGDFDFLNGDWHIENRRLDPATGQWDHFVGESTCWSILDGLVSIEELRIPARQFAGMGLRILDRDAAVWKDYWTNARNGVLASTPSIGHFAGPIGEFHSEYTDGEGALRVRGVWEQVDAQCCRWSQATSRDGGHTWQPNWEMTWRRKVDGPCLQA